MANPSDRHHPSRPAPMCFDPRNRNGIRLALAVGCLTALSCGKPVETTPQSEPEVRVDPPAPAAVETSPAEEVVAEGPSASYPTFGVAFEPPDGWTADGAIAQSGFLGRWVADPTNPDDWRQFTVDVRPLPADPMQRLALASRPAQALLGRGYERQRTTLDGVPADRFDAPPRDPNANPLPTPSPVFVTQHDGRAYRLVFLLNDPEDQPPGLVESVTESWKWLPAEPVTAHLALGEAESLFDGVGSIRLPKLARADSQLAGDGSVAFTVFDYARGQDAIVIALELDTAPDPPDLREQVVAYSERVEKNAQLPIPLSFDRPNRRADLYASDVLEGRFQEGEQTVTRLCRYAVWRPGPGKLVRVQAVINSEVFTTEADLRSALAAVEASLLSLSNEP